MTKSELIALSNTNIADASNITAESHREVNDAIVDYVAGTVTPGVNGVQYTKHANISVDQFLFYKTGRTIFLEISFSTTGSIPASTGMTQYPLFELLAPISPYYDKIFPINHGSPTFTTVRGEFFGNKIISLAALSSGISGIISITYPTNE